MLITDFIHYLINASTSSQQPSNPTAVVREQQQTRMANLKHQQWPPRVSDVTE